MKQLIYELRKDPHPRQIVRAFRRFWGRHSAGLAWLTLVLLFGIGLIVVQHEGQRREEQFCQLVLDSHQDDVNALSDTKDYFASAAGQERTTFNGFIVSFTIPKQISDVVKSEGQIPPVCDQYRDPDTYDTPQEVTRKIQQVQEQLAEIQNQAQSGPPPRR